LQQGLPCAVTSRLQVGHSSDIRGTLTTSA
jgi:hypothetical protein